LRDQLSRAGLMVIGDKCW